MPVRRLLTPMLGSVAAVAHSKSEDFGLLVDFLERENQRCEFYKTILGAIGRIGSLAAAEAEARQALEAAQIDLAWALTELERAQTAVISAKDDARRDMEDLQLMMETEKARIRRQYEEETSAIEAAIAEKRTALSKLVRRLDEAQKAASLLADVLRVGD